MFCYVMEMTVFLDCQIKMAKYILGVSQYTGIDDNRDIQSMKYRHRVNLEQYNIPVLAILAFSRRSARPRPRS